MKRPLATFTLAAAICAPLSVAGAQPVSVRIDTPEFGIRIGHPVPPFYAPSPVVVAPMPPVVHVPPPRVIVAPPPAFYAYPPPYYRIDFGWHRHRWHRDPWCEPRHRHGHDDDRRSRRGPQWD
ncbi:MAG: hypothetical protein RMK97_10160 [Sutterellaceae bacterium]|nr:hypothetical protein [Burkholderiaceae bacterium]MCX7902219.1 hypothetical protein [Burkholderiaceae bacterium]MDW8430845.1 hypothetical protein [Sutterellaceae bacterium]